MRTIMALRRSRVDTSRLASRSSLTEEEDARRCWLGLPPPSRKGFSSLVLLAASVALFLLLSCSPRWGEPWPAKEGRGGGTSEAKLHITHT